jgi:predicted HTH transcriptional regulator
VWEGDWSQFEREPESQVLDFKEAKPASVAKHLAAFANSLGGWLVFGIYDPARRESGKVARNLELSECAEILDAVCEAGLRDVTPAIVPSAFFRGLPDGQMVLLCRIDRSLTGPHRVGGKIYSRIGTMSRPVADDEWDRLVGPRRSTLGGFDR